MSAVPRLANLRYVRERDILKALPMGKTTLWELVGKKDFPQPIKLSKGITVWNEAEVLSWIESRSSDGTSDGTPQADAGNEPENHALGNAH